MSSWKWLILGMVLLVGCAFNPDSQFKGEDSPDSPDSPDTPELGPDAGFDVADTPDAASSPDGNGEIGPGGDDDDDDGVEDAADNCPGKSNPAQYDEDADGVGDKCDNCIAYPNTGQANGDGDDLGDPCDPQEGAHNELLFFEGFNEPLNERDWSGTDNWHVDTTTGDLVTNDNLDRYHIYYLPVTRDDKIRAVTRASFSDPLPPDGRRFRFGGLMAESHPSSQDGYGCWPLRYNGSYTTTDSYSVIHSVRTTLYEIREASTALATDMEYDIKIDISGSTKTCRFKGNGAERTVAASYQYDLEHGNVGLAVTKTITRYPYLYAVSLQ